MSVRYGYGVLIFPLRLESGQFRCAKEGIGSNVHALYIRSQNVYRGVDRSVYPFRKAVQSFKREGNQSVPRLIVFKFFLLGTGWK